jgi:hypothetical protein
VPSPGGGCRSHRDARPGWVRGGEEAQDLLICESLPGGPREVKIKASEWPRYRDRSTRGPCAGAPVGGPTAGAAASLPPAMVLGAAGTLPAGPPPAGGGSTLRLEAGGRVRVTLLGARTNLCDGDLVLLAPPLAGTPLPGGPNAGLPPGARRLWASYLRHLGASTQLGPYPAETELLLGIAVPPTSVCASGGSAPRPSDGPSARIARPAPGIWEVWWEDWLRPAGGDFDDLVLGVELLPASP